MDFCDVTLVSHDTLRRLNWCDSSNWYIIYTDSPTYLAYLAYLVYLAYLTYLTYNNNNNVEEEDNDNDDDDEEEKEEDLAYLANLTYLISHTSIKVI